MVAERRVRAVIERTYTLRILAAQIQPDEAAAMTPEQRRELITRLRQPISDMIDPAVKGNLDFWPGL